MNLRLAAESPELRTGTPLVAFLYPLNICTHFFLNETAQGNYMGLQKKKVEVKRGKKSCDTSNSDMNQNSCPKSFSLVVGNFFYYFMYRYWKILQRMHFLHTTICIYTLWIYYTKNSFSNYIKIMKTKFSSHKLKAIYILWQKNYFLASSNWCILYMVGLFIYSFLWRK